MSENHTIGSFLFDYLYNQGVKCAFGLPGDFALPTFRWLDKSKMDLINMTHEPSVGFAADAYARVNGLGVAVVTYCVGGLNMLNSIAGAYAEKSPVIVISGGPSVQDRKKNPLLHHKVRTFDTQRRIFEEVTCANTVLLDPDNAAAEIMRVVEAVKEHCRPGYIEIPYDIVDMPCKIPAIKNMPAPESDKEMLEVCLKEAVEMINRAKQPVIIADVELHRHGFTDLALQIATKFSIPITSTLLSKSIIDETHPLYIGVYSGALSEPACQKYVEESDCMIMLGAFITDVFLGLQSSSLDRKNSILVTTEEARIGYHSYSGVLFKDFLEGLINAPINKRGAFHNPNPPRKIEPLQESELKDELSVQSFFDILSLYLNEKTTIVSDTGDALLGAIGIRIANYKNFLSDAYYLSMGFSVPAAIGAMAADPDDKVMVVVGDGAFQMTGIELSTVAKYKLAPIVFIINNDGYGTQRHIIDGPFNVIHMWDYTKMVDLLRYGKAFKVHNKGELDEAIKFGMDSNEMTLVEVVVPRDDCSVSLRRMAEELGKLRDVTKKAS